MPRKSGDQWLVDIRPYGTVGPRVRKKFRTKAEAIRFEAYDISKAKDSPREPQVKDVRKLSELIELLRLHHGQHISSGQQRIHPLKAFATFTCNKQGRLVQSTNFLNFRSQQLSEGKSINTVNAYLMFAKGLYNRLAKLEIIITLSPITAKRSSQS